MDAMLLTKLFNSYFYRQKREKRRFSHYLWYCLSSIVLLTTFSMETDSAQAAVTVKSTTFTETVAGEPLTYFYLDLAPTPILRGMYVSFEVQNDGVARNDVWVRLDAPAYSSLANVSLAPNEDGLVNLGPMAAGEKKVAFFYLYSGANLGQGQEIFYDPIQKYPVQVFNGRPDLSSATNLASTTLNIKQIQETIDASSNKVDTVVIDTDASTPAIDSGAPQLGGLVSINITAAATGNLTQADQLQFTPAAYVDWPADTFELIGTSITLTPSRSSTSQIFQDQIAFSFGITSNYTTKYVFRVVGMTGGSTRISPIVNIKSGTNFKHTDTGSYNLLPTVPPPVSKLTLSKLVSQSQLTTGGTVTYTLRLTNTGTADAVIQDFCDTLPVGLTSAAYQSGTSEFNGTTISNPVTPSATSDCPSATLLWAGNFTIPAGQSRDLTYQVMIPNTNGSYTNSAIAHINGVQIDSTLITTDNAPATVTVVVGDPTDLTLTKSDGGNSFAAGGTGTYAITVNNIGAIATSGQMTVTDSLPSGLSLPDGSLSLSGTHAANWSCSVTGNVITCTSNAAIAAGGSSTFNFNVNVANNAPTSVTNTASVSGGGEPATKNGNNSGQDITPITFAPDLTLTKSDGGASFAAGGTGSYTLSIHNTGTGATTGQITVTDSLPAELTVSDGLLTLSGTHAADWTCSATGNVITCTSDTAIAANGSSTFNFNVNVASNANSSITNTASVSGGGEPTVNNGNNSASETTPIQNNSGSPHILLVKRITGIGDETNTTTGENFSLYYNDTSNPYDDNKIGPELPSAPAAIHDTDKWPGTTENISSTFLTGVINAGVVKPAEEIEYTIYFLSSGSMDAKNVQLCDRIPANTTFVSNTFGSGMGIFVSHNGGDLAYTNASDSDNAMFYPPSATPLPAACGGDLNSNETGAIVVKLGNLMFATGQGQPNNSYGYLRFRVLVN
jgi:uncharacterized repeat protein (TIGR01451 family)